MPLVSLLMPVYNRESLVVEAICSIQNQTFRDWELLILDDASTDNTLGVCRTYEAGDSRIRVFRNQENLGCGAGRNRLLTLAAGKYIALQDSDDVSLPDRLAVEIDVLESKPEIGLVSGIASWVDVQNDRELSKYPPYLRRGLQYPRDHGELVRLLYSDCEVAIPTCMLRSSLIHEMSAPFGKYRFVDDWYFLLRFAHQAGIWGIPEVLVKMARGTTHSHLWADFEAAMEEAKRMKRDIYEMYKYNSSSAINYRQYRRSVAALLTAKGRHRKGMKGYFNLLESLFWDPFYGNTYQSFRKLTGHAVRTGKRVAIRSFEKQAGIHD